MSVTDRRECDNAHIRIFVYTVYWYDTGISIRRPAKKLCTTYYDTGTGSTTVLVSYRYLGEAPTAISANLQK